MDKKHVMIIVIAVILVVASTYYSIISSFSEKSVSEQECLEMEDVNRDSCFCLLAMQKSDLSIVEGRVSNNYAKECYSTIAMKTQNSSLCEKTGSLEDYCLKNT